jgi:hypothetical protein
MIKNKTGIDPDITRVEKPTQNKAINTKKQSNMKNYDGHVQILDKDNDIVNQAISGFVDPQIDYNQKSAISKKEQNDLSNLINGDIPKKKMNKKEFLESLRGQARNKIATE